MEVPVPDDRQGWRHKVATLDLYLADRRATKAAKRFRAKALRRSRDCKLQVINNDKNPAYGEAIAELKKEGLLPEGTRHRQVTYLNNCFEGDPGKLKRLIKPMLGFQSMCAKRGVPKTAYATIKGLEVMRMFRKGQFKFWIEAVSGGTEASLVNRLFGVYA
jgi:transposase-like protein